MAIVHDLELAQDLFPHGGLGIDQDNLKVNLKCQRNWALRMSTKENSPSWP